jgi:hypothetical protein
MKASKRIGAAGSKLEGNPPVIYEAFLTVELWHLATSMHSYSI